MHFHAYTIIRCLLCFGLLVASFNGSAAQELPNTPAAKRLGELIECLNEKDDAARMPFLKNSFSEKDGSQPTVEQRAEIVSSMHERFAPFEVVEVAESEELRISAKCKTSSEAMILIEVDVTPKDDHKIVDVGMSPIESEVPESVPPGMVRLFDEEGKSVEAARGIWEAKGYGYVFEVNEDSYVLYNVTKSFALEEEFEADLFFKKGDDASTALVTMHEQEHGYDLTRLEKLPPQCAMKFAWKPTQVFDAFLEIFRESYPFFKERNINWEQRANKFRPTITDESTDAELFEAMTAMLKDLGDGHVSMQAEIDGKERRIRSNKPNTLNRLRASFTPSDKFKNRQS